MTYQNNNNRRPQETNRSETARTTARWEHYPRSYQPDSDLNHEMSYLNHSPNNFAEGENREEYGDRSYLSHEDQSYSAGGRYQPREQHTSGRSHYSQHRDRPNSSGQYQADEASNRSLYSRNYNPDGSQFSERARFGLRNSELGSNFDEEAQSSSRRGDESRHARSYNQSRTDWQNPRTSQTYGGDSIRQSYGDQQTQRKSPKGYTRSDERIYEEVCETLSRNGDADPTDVEVKVEKGVVTLSGTVTSRQVKRMIEDSLEHLYGMQDLKNEIKIQQSSQTQSDISQSNSQNKQSLNTKSLGSSSRQSQ